jgi:hypothetical protein
MTIETKYNIGQEVWVRYGNSPLKCIIIDRNDTTGYYLIEGVIDNVIRRGIKHPKTLFPTKEELIKSL